MSIARRWDPFSYTGEDQVGSAGGRGAALRAELGAVGPSMDMYETDEGLVVQLSLPGVAPEDVNVTVTGDTLTIRGEFRTEEADATRQYLLRERAHGTGRFSRSVLLPRDVVGAKAEATFRNGVLTLTVPRAEESRPKQVQVKPVQA